MGKQTLIKMEIDPGNGRNIKNEITNFTFGELKLRGPNSRHFFPLYNYEDFFVVRESDKETPIIWEHYSTKKPFPEIRVHNELWDLDVKTGGPSKRDILLTRHIYSFSDVLVMYWSEQQSARNGLPEEMIQFQFQNFKVLT